MEVGMYVRTKRGQIGKIKTIGKDDIAIEFNGMWQDIVSKTNIVKEPSFDILDLIEEGDYVNGYKVSFIAENLIEGQYVQCDYPVEVGSTNHYRFYEKDIYSIVTKEQFEQISYKVVN